VAAGDLLPPLAVSHFLSADSADFLAVQFGTAAELAVAMREHLTAASAAAAEAAAGGGGGAALPVAASPVDAADAAGAAAAEAPAAEGAAAATDSQSAAGAARRRLGERQAEQAAALLLRWVEEQEGGAYEAVEQAKSSLLALKVGRHPLPCRFGLLTPPSPPRSAPAMARRCWLPTAAARRIHPLPCSGTS
jgi:hypothetical protein